MLNYAKIAFEQYQYCPQVISIASIGVHIYAQIDGEIPAGWTEIDKTEYLEAVPELEPERTAPPAHTNTDVIQKLEDIRVDLIIAGVIDNV